MWPVVITMACTLVASTIIGYFIYTKAVEKINLLKKELKDLKDAENFKRYAKEIASITPGITVVGVNGSSEIEMNVVREIGNGAQGKVFHVKVKEQDMALKIFCPSSQVFEMGNEIIHEAHKRFKNEKLIKAIDHDNIVKMHNYFDSIIIISSRETKEKWILHHDQLYKHWPVDSGKYEHRTERYKKWLKTLSLEEINNRVKCTEGADKELPLPAFVMDLYQDNILQAINYRKIRYTAFESYNTAIKILYLIYQLIKAIEYLHDKSIIHRDIKPENLMIKKNIAALGDFGVAYWKDFAISSGQSMTNINTNFAPGTHTYIAPELQKNKGKLYSQKRVIYIH